MKHISIIFSLLMGVTTSIAQAQMWGTGQWGGMQGCGYQTAQAPGASNVSDEMKELQQNLAQAKKDLAAKKSDKKKVERDLEKARKDITDNVQSGYADFAITHIESGQTCEAYAQTDGKSADLPVVQDDDGLRKKTSRNRRALKTTPFKADEWASLCLPGTGSVSSELCTEYRDSDSKGNSSICAKALPTLKKKFAESQKIDNEIENLQRSIERANDEIKDARNNKTEGGICIECMQKNNGYQAQMQQPQTNWAGVIGGIGMGLASMYAGYQTNKTVAQYNSNLGFPTQPTQSALSYGYPYFASAVAAYGGMGSGVGQGGFGCGNTMGANNGAFGYPNSMMNGQMGGGMYNGGMAGPWGNTNSLYGNPYGMYGNSMLGNSMYSNPYASMYGNSMYGNSMYGNSLYGNGMGGYGSYNTLAMMQMQLQMNSLMGRINGTGLYGSTNSYSSSGSITNGTSNYGYTSYPYSNYSTYPYSTGYSYNPYSSYGTYSPYNYSTFSGYAPATTLTTTTGGYIGR